MPKSQLERIVIDKTSATKKPKAPLLIGWREWVALPELGINTINAKVDTGAATSSLYASKLKHFFIGGKIYVRFVVHPLQRSQASAITVEAPLIDERKVKSSNGDTELRPVIKTKLALADHTWTIELTLSERKNMAFRMLLGREALRRHALVDVSKSYLAKNSQKELK